LALTYAVSRDERLAALLRELIRSKILSIVPLDSSNAKPLRYSRDRRIVWIVGPAGKDNDGLRKDQVEASAQFLNRCWPPGSPKISLLSKSPKNTQEYDLVWDIPPLEVDGEEEKSAREAIEDAPLLANRSFPRYMTTPDSQRCVRDVRDRGVLWAADHSAAN